MNRVDRFIVESSSWATFHAAASLLTNKEKGDLFERVAQLYLETTPEYRAALTDVWPLHKTPAHVLAEIGLPGNDVGIDLIAHHRDGRFWAIQAKFRTNEDKALRARLSALRQRPAATSASSSSSTAQRSRSAIAT